MILPTPFFFETAIKLLVYKGTYPNKNIFIFENGRKAIKTILESFSGDKSSFSSVGVPSLICNSAIEELNLKKFKIVFFDQDFWFNFSKELFEKNLNYYKPKTFIINDLFQFQPEINEIISICNKMKINIIYDRCHSLPDYDFYKKSSNLCSVYSLRKFNNIYPSGLVIGNFDDTELNYSSKWNFHLKHYLRFIFKDFFNLFKKSYKIQLIKRLYKRKRRITFKRKNKHSISNKMFYSNHLIRNFLSPENINHIKKYRLRNNNFFESKIPSCFLFNKKNKKNLLPSISYIIKNPFKHLDLVEYLRNEGIWAYQWPGEELPNEFNKHYKSFANKTNKSIIVIPNHEFLKIKEKKIIIKKLSLILGTKNEKI